MKGNWEAARWNRRVWAVYDKTSRLFFFIGMGRRFCERKAEELNRLYPVDWHGDGLANTLRNG